MGSFANPDDFMLKGGLEAFEVFKRLSEKFNNLNFVVSCKTPEFVKEKYKDLKNIMFIEKKISKEQLTQLWVDTDIMLNPGHVYVLMSTLEAMSYGVPIVFLDTYAVRDYIQNKVNGILVKPSDKILGYKEAAYPTNARSKKFMSEVQQLDEDVIERLCLAVEKLIKSSKLRKEFGLAGKKLAETKFSILDRNRKLNKIFEEAIK
jgi:glycosyltransferase involved in cell wall biosynthesis